MVVRLQGHLEFSQVTDTFVDIAIAVRDAALDALGLADFIGQVDRDNGAIVGIGVKATDRTFQPQIVRDLVARSDSGKIAREARVTSASDCAKHARSIIELMIDIKQGTPIVVVVDVNNQVVGRCTSGVLKVHGEVVVVVFVVLGTIDAGLAAEHVLTGDDKELLVIVGVIERNRDCAILAFVLRKNRVVGA